MILESNEKETIKKTLLKHLASEDANVSLNAAEKLMQFEQIEATQRLMNAELKRMTKDDRH